MMIIMIIISITITIIVTITIIITIATTTTTITMITSSIPLNRYYASEPMVALGIGEVQGKTKLR